MKHYSEAAVERMMKVQEVIMRALAKKIRWYEAAEILGISVRQMRRRKDRWDRQGYDGLFDRRLGKPSPKRVLVSTVEEVLRLYQEQYYDFNVKHFHEKLKREHQLKLSYTWVKTALQTAGLVQRRGRRSKHRKRREPRPLPGMMLHIDGSKHKWFNDSCYYDLIVVLDDASNEIYYAQLVEAESTLTVMAALRAVIEAKGLFCSLYCDRASHFFLTPKAGERVSDKHITQVGRALAELGIRLIPAYSPEARGRSERSFRTWQGRLPQELRRRGIVTLPAANEFLREHYLAEFNSQFARPAKEPGTAFTSCPRQDLDFVFALLHERTVARDNTVSYGNRVLQLEKTKWRFSLAGCKVNVYEHADQTLSVVYGPHVVGRYDQHGALLAQSAIAQAQRKKARGGKKRSAVEMPPLGKATKDVASLRGLGKSRSRLASVSYADTSTTTYTYDSASRITQIVDSLSGTIGYGYDDLDRLTSETTPQGVVNYTYDAANRRTSMTVGGQPTVTYTYDNANRLTQVSQGSSTVVMAYDAAGRRTSLTLPNGVVTEYTYDLASQLTSLTYKRSGNVLGNLTYEYDAAGRRIRFGGSFARTVSPQPFSSATYNTANRQLTARGQTLTYDLNGNLESDGTNNYTWDARGRLASISGPNNTATFQYDALGRRISKTVNEVTTVFLYDGFKIVQEQSVSLGNANLLNGGIDEVFARNDSGGSWSPLRDVLGSYISLSDSAGTLTGEYAYEPFGHFAANGTSNSTNSTHYTGRENDGTGLQFNRARYYSPALQRFISEDPIGMRGGMNLYAYAGNNPLGFSDPFGTNPAVGVWKGAVLGGEIGAIGGPIGIGVGAVVGGIVGGVVTYYATDAISKTLFAPASFPDPLNPPSDWVRHPSGKPDTWIDPNGDTWRWHPDPSGKHGGDHWDIGGPKPAGGGKGKQDWWPKGGTREPKPPGSMRFYFPQKLGDPKDIVEGIDFDPHKHDPIDYAP